MILSTRVIALWCVAILLVTAKTWGVEKLKLSPRQDLADIPIEPTRETRDWLKHYPRLRVGVYPQQYSPLAQTMATGRFQDISAEYLDRFLKTLQTQITILRYEDKIQALTALKKGEIDTLLTGLESPDQNSVDSSVIASQAVIHAWPNLVASMRNITAPLASNAPATIARVGIYPNDEVIRDSFPQAQIVNYSEYGDALDAVATGKNDYFVGDSFSTGRWLSQEFSSELAILKYWPSPQKQSVFLFQEKNEKLRSLVNQVLHNMPESLRLAITQQAGDSGNPTFLVEPLPLTVQERQWLAQHKTVRVIVNPWFVPFTLLDNEKQIRGISGDLLNFISLQTGLLFETVVVTSHQQLLDEMHKGGVYIVQPAVQDNRDGAVMRYSHPYVNTQFVIVVNKASDRHPQFESGMRVAISEGHILDEALRARYPEITWLTVDNVSIALNLLANGKVDGVIANRLSARYLRQHYYPDQFSWAALPNADPPAFVFGFPLNQPVLQSIVNKVLERIPQGETLKIVSKWMRLPEAKVDTWELYNKPFYLVILLGTLLVLSSSLWAISLFVEVRKRKRSQRMLVLERNNAQRANKENREFLSRMSHEIRTPVSAIMGFLELLQISTSTFKRDDKFCIEQAAKASRSLLKLIGNVLDLEKIESGAVDVVPKWGKVDTLLNGKVALFQALATKKGIRLAYHSQLNTHDMMLIDYQLLGQVLNNIIGNALKFTQQGSVTLSAQYGAGTLTLSIQDTGPGISQYEQTRLFNTFYQGGAESQQQGSGLGLTISRALMLKMGGALLLQSELQRGTTLTITLPVKVSRHPNSLPTSPPRTQKNFRNNISILIVDDQSASRLLLYRQLEALGIQAQQAENGQQALVQLQRSTVDLMITDINMPALDGVTLTKRVRDLGMTETFICGLTATAQEHERQRCLAAGMNDCLFKPLDLSQLSILLSKVVDEVPTTFDTARLTMLTQGNRGLMLKALQDALQENYRDLAALRAGAQVADYPTMKFHIHRINGTALLLGARKLAFAALQLEDCLEQAIPAHELPAMLDNIEMLLAEFDSDIGKFTP